MATLLGDGTCQSGVAPPIQLGATCGTPFPANAVSKKVFDAGLATEHNKVVNVTSCAAGATTMVQPLHSKCGMCDHLDGIDPFDEVKVHDKQKEVEAYDPSLDPSGANAPKSILKVPRGMYCPGD